MLDDNKLNRNHMQYRQKTFYLTPLFYSFGNAAEEILWGKARAIQANKCLKIVPPARFTQCLAYKICNRELFELHTGESQKKRVIFDYFLINLTFFVSRFIALLLKRLFRLKMSEHFLFPRLGLSKIWPALPFEAQSMEKVRVDPIIKILHDDLGIRLSDDQVRRTQPSLKKLFSGAPLKYICLHVRDSGYHRDPTRRAYRNADINTYEAAIKFVVSQGLYVVRLGDPSMPSLGISDSMVIDYAHYNSRSPELDLALVANCEFYVGMQSGPLDLALLFQKPILTLNMYDWIFASPFKKIDRGLLKRVQVNGAKLSESLKERFSLDFKYTDVSAILDQEEVRFVDNTPEEILQATQDFFYDYASGFRREPSISLSESRREFEHWSLYQFNKLVQKPGDFYKLNPLELSRLVYRNFASKGYYLTLN